jgi:hypothetical protein
MTFEYSTIEEQFKKLPEEVQFALTSPHISEQIMEIAEKNGLLLDQMEVLYDITSYVMLGLLPSDRYTSTLARELNVSEKQARTITDEINNVIFVDIRNAMRQFEEKTKLQNYSEAKIPVPENQFANSINSNPYSQATSPHADLEQAGNFKIETESNLDNNISLKSPPKKSGFVTEQQMASQNAKMADMAMLTPKQNSYQNPSQVPLQSAVQPPVQQIEQRTEPTNEPSPEKPIEQQMEPMQEKPLQATSLEQKVATIEPATQNPAISNLAAQSPVTPTQEPITNQVDTASKMQAFDPKNFYNFGNIEERLSISKNEETPKEIKDMEPSPDKNIFSKTASQIHYEKGMKNKAIKMSASSQIYQPKIQENIVSEKAITPKESADQAKIEKENTALIDEMIAHPKPIPAIEPKVEKKTETVPENLPTEPIVATEPVVIPQPVIKESVPANIPSEPKIEIKPILETKKETETIIPIKKNPSMEEIRSDIRSKVSEYNPTTTWAKPIAQNPSPKITNLNTEEPSKKEQSTITPTAPKTTITPPPINRPKGFDPYREPIQ